MIGSPRYDPKSYNKFTPRILLINMALASLTFGETIIENLFKLIHSLETFSKVIRRFLKFKHSLSSSL